MMVLQISWNVKLEDYKVIPPEFMVFPLVTLHLWVRIFSPARGVLVKVSVTYAHADVSVRLVILDSSKERSMYFKLFRYYSRRTTELVTCTHNKNLTREVRNGQNKDGNTGLDTDTFYPE